LVNKPPFICYLCQPVSRKSYARQGDLTRHIKTYHGAPSRFLCYVHRCPRSITGNGFPRRDKLVDHLKSSKPGHGLSHKDAVYQAAFHNKPRLNAVPPALPHNNASYEDASQQAASLSTISNDLIDQTSGYDTVRGNAAYNLAFHNVAVGNGVHQAILDNNFYGYDVNQGIQGNTLYENPVDPATFQNIYNADARGQPTSNTTLIDNREGGSAWHYLNGSL
jgi:hypothetical protein